MQFISPRSIKRMSLTATELRTDCNIVYKGTMRRLVLKYIVFCFYIVNSRRVIIEHIEQYHGGTHDTPVIVKKRLVDDSRPVSSQQSWWVLHAGSSEFEFKPKILND